MPPGVDLETFNLTRSTQEPRELRDVRPPVFGYVGSIDDRIDFALLKRLAQTFSDGTVVLVGPVHEQIHKSRLNGLVNVRLIGTKTKSELPPFIQRMDVCLIPYRVSPFTEVILPLKIFEYLAMGKPVVSTLLPELEPYASAIHLAKNQDEFIAATRKALNDEGSQGGKARELVRPATWESRIERISAAIQERLIR